MKNTIEQLHKASQYLAAASISFLNKEPDDSHTNLGWDTTHNRIHTRIFANRFQLALRVDTAHLEWIEKGKVKDTLDLTETSHQERLLWLFDKACVSCGDKPYRYVFHYDLPYTDEPDNYKFSFNSRLVINYTNLLDIATEAFKYFMKEHRLYSEIRIWPHHFDLGIYVQIDEGLFMGAGIAVPDSLMDEMYFYATGWKNGEAMPTAGYGDKKTGEWRKDWNGATMQSSGADGEKVVVFLNEAIDVFRSNK